LLCESPRSPIVEYTLRNIDKPIGFLSFRVTRELPAPIREEVPTVEDLQEVVTKLRGEMETLRRERQEEEQGNGEQAAKFVQQLVAQIKPRERLEVCSSRRPLLRSFMWNELFKTGARRKKKTTGRARRTQKVSITVEERRAQPSTPAASLAPEK
jgi:hypothetical protein